MQRRGISEVVASILLITIIATASVLATNAASKQITENEKTVTEALHQKSTQVQELMSVISSKTNSNKIILEVLNYGIKEIIIDKVLVDGRESAFILKDGNIITTHNAIPKKKILVLETNMTGRTIQLITDTENLFNVKLW